MASPKNLSRRTGLSVAAGCIALAGLVAAQVASTPPRVPKLNEATDPRLAGFEFRSIGPATMSGRLDDIQGSAKDPLLFYIGFATGGLWKSTDGGNHWKPMLDNTPNNSIGAIAIAPL